MNTQKPKPARKKTATAAVRSAETPLRTLTWPEEFASPRVAAILLGGISLFSLLLFSVAYWDGLAGAKTAIALLLGIAQPTMVYPGSWDMAGVLWGLVMVVGLGWIHPVLGLAFLAFFRPWWDGYTYQTDNYYFVWGILYLAVIHGMRLLTRGDPLRHRMPNLLLAGFCAVAAITAVGSVQYDRTHHHLILWFSYLLLFFLVTNSVRDRKTVILLFVGLTIMMIAQTWYSILHYYYILPYMRRVLMEDPNARIYFFGESKLTPEIINRINVNRATGNMLYPNTLAGFLVLGIPFAITHGLFGWRTLLSTWRATPPVSSLLQRRRALAIAACAWLVVTVAVFASEMFPITFTQQAISEGHLYLLAVIASLAGLLPAAILGWVADRRGLHVCGLFIRVAGLSFLAIIALFALYVTFSRGALLALLAASIAGFLIYRGFSLSRVLPAHWHKYAALLLLTIAVVGLCGILSGAAGAPTAAPNSPPPLIAAPNTEPVAPSPSASQAPAENLVESGTNVTVDRMLDPATFSLRLSYWRVGAIMFWHHFWTGVGLGNFRVAYPVYQYLGAGNVQQAHNGYLQAFCETGIVGGLLLLAFCAHFVFWGARRITRETNPELRLMLAALYVGVLAFLLHAAIDIHFAHPSLGMIWMMFAGLFYAVSSLGEIHDTTQSTPHRVHLKSQVIAIPLLLLAALTVGMSLRVFLQELSFSRISFVNLAKDDELVRRYQAARFILQDVLWYAADRSKPKPQIAVSALLPLLMDPMEIGKLGEVYVPGSGGRTARLLQPGELIPPEAVLVITRPWYAYRLGQEASLVWVKNLEYLDHRFPHNPKISLQLCEWYKMMAESFNPIRHSDTHRMVVAKLKEWSEECVRRSPMHSDMYFILGQNMWLYGKFQTSSDRLNSFITAADAFASAIKYCPNIPLYFYRYHEALQRLGEAYQESGDTKQAERYFAQSAAAKAQYERVIAERNRLRVWL